MKYLAKNFLYAILNGFVHLHWFVSLLGFVFVRLEHAPDGSVVEGLSGGLWMLKVTSQRESRTVTGCMPDNPDKVEVCGAVLIVHVLSTGQGISVHVALIRAA